MEKRFKLLVIMLLAVCLLSPFGISGIMAADDAGFQPKVIAEYNFEKGNTEGWIPRGSGTQVASVNEAAQSGSSSLKTTNRSANWHGPSLNLKETLKKGAVYQISGYIKLASAPAPPSLVKFTMEQKPMGGDTNWKTVDQRTVADTQWIKLAGEFTYTEDMNGLLLYAESSNPDDAFYLDNVTITMTAAPPASAPAISMQNELKVTVECGFEKGDTEGWIPRGTGVEVAAVKEVAQSGAFSLKTTKRTANWHGPSLNTRGILKKGAVYQISGYIKLASVPAAPSVLKFTMEQKPVGGSTNWKTVAQQTIAGTQWTKLAGEYSFNEDMDGLLLYAESSSQDDVFYLDNVTITMIAPPSVSAPPSASFSPIQADLPSLKEVFADCFTIGAAVEPDQLTGLTGDLLKKHYNCIVAENVMKPESIQPQEGSFVWTNSDRIFQYAAANKMQVRFHTLVWHSQVPNWFFLDRDGKEMATEIDQTKKEANKKLLLTRLEKHITAIAERYKDKVDSWDVVNEVIDPGQPGGMRNSKWYQITGKDYIKTAFRTVRKVAGPKAKLFINDYSTHDPVKRDILYRLVKELLAEGVPIDGVGHQTHINIESPTIESIAASIKLFGDMGLDNQLTELDVSVYTNNTTSYQKVPRDVIVQQGYRYRDLFTELRKLKDYISNVTFWGVADDHSWLHNRPIPRREAPFAFDEQHQAKPAYWGMVDPAKLPILTQKINGFKGTPVIDGVEELKWKAMSWIPITHGSGVSAAFKTSWDEKRLYVLVDVKDGKRHASDVVDIFIDENNQKTSSRQDDDRRYTLSRSGKAVKNAIYKIKEYRGGYLLELSVPFQAAVSVGKQIGFDIRITNADQKPGMIAWNDLSFSQNTDTSKYGTLILAEEMKVTTAVKGTPEIDAAIDSIWSKAKAITTDTKSQDATGGMGANVKGAVARVRTLWDENYLYVLFEVSDPVLNKANMNAYEQDSVEIFIDENNGKTQVYEDDDAQYRVNYANQQSFGSNGAEPRFKTAAKAVAGGYIVEAAIPFRTLKGKDGLIIGFDVQVNDAGGSGTRQSVMTWSDTAGNNYRDTSRYGSLVLSLK